LRDKETDRKMEAVRKQSSSLSADFFGGLSGAIAVLPQTIGLSVLLFTSLGLDTSAGALAGLIGAIILMLFSGFMGATIGMISAPNGPVTILLSGLVITLKPDHAPHEMLMIMGAVLFLTGIFQIVFGLLKGGEIIKLIPYPVVTSMITGIGILMIKSQITQIIPSDSIEGWYRYIPLLVASMTVAIIYLSRRLFPSLPAIIIGFLAGILIYSLLISRGANFDPAWVIGPLPAIEFSAILQRFDGLDMMALPWLLITTSALALTVLVMIDCLLTALVADSQTSARHNSRNELIAQGMGQMLIGVVGGVGGGGTKGATLANTMAGGRRWSPVFAALIILFMALFGRDLGSFLPLSALSGVIIYIGLNMVNINIILWFKDSFTRVDAINALMVIAATLFFDVTTAVALGLVFAVVTFIRRGIKRSLIRSETNISEYPSPRKRSKKHRRILEEYGDKSRLIELQGDLYFATTDQLYQAVMDRLDGRLVIILHFRRVLSIDMSGMVLLMQLVDVARENGTIIVFAHLHKRLGFGRKMKRAFRIINSSQTKFPKMFNSTARALEYAEEQVLKHEYKDMDYRVSSPVIFEENDLCKDIDQHGIALLKKISQKQNYKSRKVVLAEGDENRMLYLVTSGFVERRLYNGPKSYKVLAKYSPGTYFGKQGFLDADPVNTRFVAVGQTSLHTIRKSDVELESGIAKNEFYATVLLSVGRTLSKESMRLISEIRRLEAL
jgi:SulP family sulfate permease